MGRGSPGRTASNTQSIVIRKGTRPLPTARAVPAIAEIVERRPADGLMRARGAILSAPESVPANGVRWSTQAGGENRIEVSAPHAVARRTRPITEIVEVGLSDGLPRSADVIEVVESGVADVCAGTGLNEGEAGNEEK